MSEQFTMKFGSGTHSRVLERLKARKDYAWRRLRTKQEQWRKDEEQHRAYVKPTEADLVREGNKAAGVPEYVTLEVPYTYGLLMAAHTYWTSVFLGRNPVLQYLPTHGTTAGGEQAVEAVMDYQTRVGRHLIPYYLWLLDAPKYGLGIVGTYWWHEKRRVSSIQEVSQTFNGVEIAGKTKKERVTKEVDGYVGNKLYNIRPQDFFWDVRKSVACFQEGEFAGRYFEISWNDLVIGESEGRYFNLDEVKRNSGPGQMHSTDSTRDMGSDQLEIPTVWDQEQFTREEGQLKDEIGNQPAFEIVVNLIPADWHLGQSRLPEKWAFTVVRERIIVGAQPLGEFHNKYPYAAIEYEIDSHQLYKRSMLEILQPLSDSLTWLLNSHFFNVRKALNNMFVYDPLRINSRDFKDPQAGLGIRLKPAAYGTNVKESIMQFQVQDVTRSHVADMNVLTGLMQRVSGINDAIMGAQSQGGRRTAQEFRGSTSFGVNRLKTGAEYMSAMGFAPLSEMMLQSTQQHLDVERTYRIAGDLLPGKAPDILVSPEQIAGFYDFIAVDGTMPVDKSFQAALWKDIMGQMVTVPGLAEEYDFGSIFAYVAQLAGAKNIQRFKLNFQSPEDIEKAVAQGNLTPVGGNSGPGQTRPATAAGSQGRPPGLSQIGGVGPAA